MAIATGMALALGAAGSTVAGIASANKAAKAQEQGAKASADASYAAAQLQADAANRSADLQLTGQRESIAAQNNALDRIMSTTQRKRDLGDAALSDMYDMAANPFTMGDYRADPGYQFRLSEGENSLARMMQAQGIGRSGAAMKGALQYSQGLASQEYGNAHSRKLAEYNNQYNQLMGVANIGAGASGQAVSAINSNAGNVQNAFMQGYGGAGNALTSGAAGQANSFMNAGNALQSGANARASGYQGVNTAVQGGFQNAAGILGMQAGGYFKNNPTIGWG